MIFFRIPFRSNTLTFLLFCDRRNLNFFTGSLLQSQSKLLGHLQREKEIEPFEKGVCIRYLGISAHTSVIAVIC